MEHWHLDSSSVISRPCFIHLSLCWEGSSSQRWLSSFRSPTTSRFKYLCSSQAWLWRSKGRYSRSRQRCRIEWSLSMRLWRCLQHMDSFSSQNSCHPLTQDIKLVGSLSASLELYWLWTSRSWYSLASKKPKRNADSKSWGTIINRNWSKERLSTRDSAQIKTWQMLSWEMICW